MANHMIKEAATVLVLSKASSAARLSSTPGLSHAKQVLEDYSVLLLKRSSHSRFMPSTSVFPGGAWDATDASPSWLQLFVSCGLSPANLRQHFRLSDSDTAPLYTRLADKMASALHPKSDSQSTTGGENPTFSSDPTERLIPEVALRITALRETFEETGLLLAVPVRDGIRQTPLAITEKETFSITSDEVAALSRSDEDHFSGDRLKADSGYSLAQWRERVQENPSKFVDLFTSSCGGRENDGLLPWLWGLVEWWSWLTPTSFPAKRFDTMFYTALLPDVPLTSEMFSHCIESDDLMVAAPSVIVQNWLAGNIWLAPPQVYELGRLGRFASMEEVLQHVKGRVGQGVAAAAVDTWLPQIYLAGDGMLSVLPGDVLYSSAYCGTAADIPILAGDLEQQRKRLNSVDEAGVAASECIEDTDKHISLNRMEMSSPNVCSLVVNVEPIYGQVVPVDLVQRFSGTLTANGPSAEVNPKSSL